MHVTFIRHGESESNITGRWQGQGDSQLSASGRAQAEQLAARLGRDAAEKIDLLLSSDLSRASDTARAIGGRLGLDVELQPAFREVDVGRWEGLTRREVAEQFADETAALATGARDVPIGGGESWMDLEARVDAAFAELVARAAGAEHVAVVAHGGVITALFAGLLGHRAAHPRRLGRVGNTAMSSGRVDGDAFTLDRWNDATHLSALGDWGTERLERGDTVLTLVAHHADDTRDTDAPVPDGGRLRAAPSVLDIERLAGAYRGLSRVYASADPRVRNAAAMLAARSEAEVDDEAVTGETLRDALATLASRHAGARVGLVASHQTIADLTARTLDLPPAGRGAVTAPAHASVTHVVLGKHGPVFADFALRVGR